MAGYTHGFAFDEALARTICERLATGETFSSISKDEGMPSRDTIRSWKESHPEFKQAWDDALLDGCHALLDETQEIADDGRNDWMERFDKDGKSLGWVLNGEHVQRSKLRIWTRHELIKRKRPDVFSDKVQLAHSGEIGRRELSDEELDAEIAKRLAAAP